MSEERDDDVWTTAWTTEVVFNGHTRPQSRGLEATTMPKHEALDMELPFYAQPTIMPLTRQCEALAQQIATVTAEYRANQQALATERTALTRDGTPINQPAPSEAEFRRARRREAELRGRLDDLEVQRIEATDALARVTKDVQVKLNAAWAVRDRQQVEVVIAAAEPLLAAIERLGEIRQERGHVTGLQQDAHLPSGMHREGWRHYSEYQRRAAGA